MIIEMAATALITAGSFSTKGASKTARFVAEQAEAGRRHFQSSYCLGQETRNAFEELVNVAESSHQPNWDGYGAQPVADETFTQAYRFLESLPPGTPPPTVSAEPDGHLAFEWHRSAHRTLSVSVSADGDIHYSALLGPNRAFGTEVFFGEMPKSVLELIHRVQPA